MSDLAAMDTRDDVPQQCTLQPMQSLEQRVQVMHIMIFCAQHKLRTFMSLCSNRARRIPTASAWVLDTKSFGFADQVYLEVQSHVPWSS